MARSFPSGEILINVLIVGDLFRAEAVPLADWIKAALQPVDRRDYRNTTAAFQHLSHGSWVPDLAIVFQSFPDEYSTGDLEQLLALAPLVRLVVCCGAWCESDNRTRSCWPVAVRVPMHSARSKLQQEWDLLREQGNVPPLPLSASREEVFAFDHADMRPAASLHIAVDTPDPAYRSFLIELLNQHGFAPHASQSSPGPCDAIVFDADPLNCWRQARLQELRELYPGRPVVAVSSAMLAQDIEQLMELKAAVVVAKLGSQQRLLDAILSVHSPRPMESHSN